MEKEMQTDPEVPWVLAADSAKGGGIKDREKVKSCFLTLAAPLAGQNGSSESDIWIFFILYP